MLMNYDYLICGLRVRFEIPWAVAITEESKPFLIAPGAEGAPDLTLCFAPVEELNLPETGGIWDVNAYYLPGKRGQRIWHCPVRGEPPYCCVVWGGEDDHAVTCNYVRGQEHQIAFTKNLLELLGLEQFLLRFGGALLHASVVSWQGRGILFCAPSGTGKSTQAKLWERHLGSQTLNGDRAGIRCQAGVWTVWGLPYAGTSGIYRNESVPIRAIVLLQQGVRNRIAPVSPIEAFRGLLPECNARRWDANFMDQLVSVLSALIGGVPVYQLECKADVQAVELLRDRILEED